LNIPIGYCILNAQNVLRGKCGERDRDDFFCPKTGRGRKDTMKILLYISLTIAVVCVLLVAVTKLWFTLVNALVFLVILFLVAAILVLLFRRNKTQP
jgi:hypothetical protein